MYSHTAGYCTRASLHYIMACVAAYLRVCKREGERALLVDWVFGRMMIRFMFPWTRSMSIATADDAMPTTNDGGTIYGFHIRCGWFHVDEAIVALPIHTNPPLSSSGRPSVRSGFFPWCHSFSCNGCGLYGVDRIQTSALTLALGTVL